MIQDSLENRMRNSVQGKNIYRLLKVLYLSAIPVIASLFHFEKSYYEYIKILQIFFYIFLQLVASEPLQQFVQHFVMLSSHFRIYHILLSSFSNLLSL